MTPAERPRIVVTGSRTWTDVWAIHDALKQAHAEHPDAVLVHGAAYGTDCIAAALWQHVGLPVEPHHPNWRTHGRAAGPIRSEQMIDLPGVVLCLAFIRRTSPGATHCAAYAARKGIPVRRFEADS